MGNLFGGAKKPTVEKVPTPEESEGISRLEQQKRARRIAAQETLLSNKEDETKLLG